MTVRMTLAEIDARITRTEQLMVRANGEWYSQLTSDLASYRALRASIMEKTT